MIWAPRWTFHSSTTFNLQSLGSSPEQSHTSWSHPHNSWAKPHSPLPDHPAPSVSKFSSCYFFSPRLMEQTGLPTNHTNARAWITDVAGKMWQFWLCLCCCHLADQLAHCMIRERVLQCFTCESKQVDPFHPPFSKVKLWRDTRKHPYRSNGRGKAYSLKEKQTNQQNIITFYHFPCSCLNSLRPLHLGLHTWFLLPIRFGAGDLEGDLTFWEFPPFSAIFPTFITADIMASMEDKSAPSKLFGELGDTL